MNIARKLPVLILCAMMMLAVTGCGDFLSDFGHGGRTGFDGQVIELFIPGAPTEEPVPMTRPMPGIFVTVENAAGAAVAIVESDADGKFSLDISPGTYTLRPQELKDSPLRAAAVLVTVRRGSVSNITVTYGGAIYP